MRICCGAVLFFFVLCESVVCSSLCSSRHGRVASFTIVRRGVSRAYEAPYVVALIDLDEGPRMMSSVVGSEPENVAVGDTVDVQFEPWGQDYLMPVFHKTK